MSSSVLARNAEKAWEWCSNCLHTHQNLVVPVEQGYPLSVLHAACLLLDPSSIPFYLSLCMGSRETLCSSPLSVASVIFSLLHTVKMLSLLTPPFHLAPFGIRAGRWKQNHLSWPLKRQKVHSDVRSLWRHRDHTGDGEENIWMERSHLFSLVRA